MTPREATYNALLKAYHGEGYIKDSLGEWHPSDPRDFALAQEIANGVMRMTRTLDTVLETLSKEGKLSLKLREKIILRMALYQHMYLDRVPTHAIGAEAAKLAKQHCHSRFLSYLHAMIHQFPQELPSSISFGERYSYPDWFVNALIKDYGKEVAVSVMEAGNTTLPTFVRVRSPIDDVPEGFHWVSQPDVGTIVDPKVVADDPRFYIQNRTPIELIKQLLPNISKPRQILDLCAAPGGKGLFLSDLFPDAVLHMNDVSETKLNLISQNLEKYGKQANLTCSTAEKFSGEDLFDLIICDLPCSNSGVLGKRPEARWRLSSENLKALADLQKGIVGRAAKLLSSSGTLLFMTCSILKQENEDIVLSISEEFELTSAGEPITILPSAVTGHDGGFAQALVKQSL
jgi:16S rRNA (cytosine967-C5)-methyltransferase